MDKKIVLEQKKNRLATMENNGKNLGGQSGVCKKLRREIRNLEK